MLGAVTALECYVGTSSTNATTTTCKTSCSKFTSGDTITYGCKTSTECEAETANLECCNKDLCNSGKGTPLKCYSGCSSTLYCSKKKVTCPAGEACGTSHSEAAGDMFHRGCQDKEKCSRVGKGADSKGNTIDSCCFSDYCNTGSSAATGFTVVTAAITAYLM